MFELTRRWFLGVAGASGVAIPAGLPDGSRSDAAGIEICPLDGVWGFRTDPENRGEAQGWQSGKLSAEWMQVQVPHTWQTSEQFASYMGPAWYVRQFYAPAEWAGRTVRLEFEAVYHSAKVWLNGQFLGAHDRKGYTAFQLNASGALKAGSVNTLVVRADNSFDEHMLPRGRSFDWTVDGGIYRPVQLLITGPVFVERVDVDALPDPASGNGDVELAAVVRNAGRTSVRVSISYRIYEEQNGRVAFEAANAGAGTVQAGAAETLRLAPAVIANARLWHFDHPNLYRAEVELKIGGKLLHRCSATFGIRRIEVKGTALYLNGERVRLMGVERMAGSNPRYGMAEPPSWIEHDHDDLKELNCVFTRVHWPQDRRVLDYCDRNGILIQTEVPSWGPHTFSGMKDQPDPDIMQNGLEQLREMIARDRNHPSVFAWGLCNEVDGQNPPAKEFARRLYREAKRLDPHRLCTYASNSLFTTPEKDVSGEMDFISCNEYYGSWQKGDTADVVKLVENIHRAFPDKMLVISEYGYCECRPEFTGADPERIRIMREHTEVFRKHDYIGGVIFFCYNDYRTHIGDKGIGVLKQRVHGVVDLYGGRKPSFEHLRAESSHVQSLAVGSEAGALTATLAMRDTLPAYAASGYKLRWIAYGHGGLPMEEHELSLPLLNAGRRLSVPLKIEEKNPRRVRVDVVRPTGFSVLTAEWKPGS